MVLARAQLSASSSGVVAAESRQNALLGKGKFRKAEHVAREAPVGSLNIKNMPRRKNAAKSVEAQEKFKKSFGSWLRSSLSGKVCAQFLLVPQSFGWRARSLGSGFVGIAA